MIREHFRKKKQLKNGFQRRKQMSKKKPYFVSCRTEFNCSRRARCSVSMVDIISFTIAIMALNCWIVKPFSMLSGTRNGIILVAMISFVIPSFLLLMISLNIPVMEQHKILDYLFYYLFCLSLKKILTNNCHHNSWITWWYLC